MRGDHLTALHIHPWINQQRNGPRRRIESGSSEIDGRFDPIPSTGNQPAPQSLRAVSAGLSTSTSAEPSPLVAALLLSPPLSLLLLAPMVVGMYIIPEATNQGSLIRR